MDKYGGALDHARDVMDTEGLPPRYRASQKKPTRRPTPEPHDRSWHHNNDPGFDNVIRAYEEDR